MVTANNESHQKLWFPRRIRELRVAAGKKQREIADRIGMKANSYANAESSNFKRMSRERVEKLAAVHSLDPAATAQLLAGWEQLPIMEFKQRQAETFEKRKVFRSKLKGFDRMKNALAGLVALLLTVHPSAGELCICTFGEPDRPCELCDALKMLGIAGWTTQDEVMRQLAELQEKIANTGKAAT